MGKYSLESGTPLPVVGQVQGYAWGKVGAASRIASFVERVVPNAPLAEYWLGCHPKGPAEAILPDGSRCSLIEVLSGAAALPFMVKVLSINPDFGLSIQSHPDSVLARELHARDPQHYPDPFHKPEVGVALTPVQLLYDIRPAAALCEVVRVYPELCELFSDRTRELLATFEGAKSELEVSVRRAVFVDCITANGEAVKRVVSAILNRHPEKGAPPMAQEVLLIRRLVNTHGLEDVGLVGLLVMNIVSLSPGEGIFIGPNVPHAYLDGDLVECMACSDNVIRAGLTSKFRDVKTLVETTQYRPQREPYQAPKREVSPFYTEFLLPVREFCLGVVHAGAENISIDLSDGHALALCVGTRAVISCGDGKSCVTLGDGGAALLPKEDGRYLVSTDSAQLFVARSGASL